MKKSIVVASLVLASSCLVAQDSMKDWAIGFEVGGLKSDAKNYVNNVASDADISTSFEAIKIGKYFDYGRLGASLGIMNEDKGTDGYFIGASYDYMFYNSSKLTPFLGVTASYGWNEANYDIKHNGFMYGLEAGTIYNISDKIELETGLRYLKSNVDGSKNILGNDVKVEVDSVVQYYIGVNYKF